jgi:hypothetical protein
LSFGLLRKSFNRTKFSFAGVLVILALPSCLDFVELAVESVQVRSEPEGIPAPQVSIQDFEVPRSAGSNTPITPPFDVSVKTHVIQIDDVRFGCIGANAWRGNLDVFCGIINDSDEPVILAFPSIRCYPIRKTTGTAPNRIRSRGRSGESPRKLHDPNGESDQPSHGLIPTEIPAQSSAIFTVTIPGYFRQGARIVIPLSWQTANISREYEVTLK